MTPRIAMEREILSRISVMTGSGYGLDDIVSRLGIDMQVRITSDLVRTLQGELGLVRATPRSELQARLLAHGLSEHESVRLTALVWDHPAEAGIILAGKGLMNRGSRVLHGVPRATANVVKCGAELWRIGTGRIAVAVSRVQRLMAETGLESKALSRLIPGSETAFNGTEIRVNLPRGKNPFKMASSGSSTKKKNLSA